MKAHELPVAGHKNRQRVGRGISAGQGKTAGRGTKGQKARTGKKLRAGFEGGQLPLMMRIPKKKGFRSIRVPAQIVYTADLEKAGVKSLDNQSLAEHGLVVSPYHTIKVIQKGELKKAINITAQAASKGALEAITAAGGSFTKAPTPIKESTKPKSTDDK
jgi:large subunit ribosomal protein L15